MKKHFTLSICLLLAIALIIFVARYNNGVDIAIFSSYPFVLIASLVKIYSVKHQY